MAIPGLKPSYDVKAKVRVGIKNARGYPQSVDYFVCDHPEFPVGQPKELRILFPFADAADNFSTGLEFWRGKQLTCYSKGETKDGKTQAYRVNAMLDGFEVTGEPMGRGKERTPVHCRFRECPNFIKHGDKPADCKPMGRLQFFLEGGHQDEVWQIDTKSWNTIEGMEATLASARGDLRGRVFILSVAIQKKGKNQFPVVSLREETVKIENANDVALADSLLALNKARATGDEHQVRAALADTLELSNPGWRQRPEFIARIKEIGVMSAADGMLKRFDA